MKTDIHHFKPCDECGHETNYAAHAYDEEVATQDYLKDEATLHRCISNRGYKCTRRLIYTYF